MSFLVLSIVARFLVYLVVMEENTKKQANFVQMNVKTLGFVHKLFYPQVKLSCHLLFFKYIHTYIHTCMHAYIHMYIYIYLYIHQECCTSNHLSKEKHGSQVSYLYESI